MDISIIIPCYNAIGKVETCIASLLKIDYPIEKYEIIFIDDCSTDETFSYLEEQCTQYKNWRAIRLSKNTGSPSAPRNQGIELSSGKYIFFLDCDDEIMDDTLSCNFEIAEKENADLVRGYLLVDDGNKRYPLNQIKEEINFVPKAEKIKKIISKQSTTVPSFIRKSLLDKYKVRWDQELRMGEDTVFLIEVLAKAENIIYLNHPTFVYNKRISSEASSTQTYGSRELKNHLSVWQIAQEKLSDLEVDYYKLRLQVGLQTALQAMINFNSYDISRRDFNDFSQFILQNKKLISSFNYSERLKTILDNVYQNNYLGFLQSIKPRMVIAGYDLKFIMSMIPSLEKYYQIRIDEWTGHNTHDEKQSLDCLKWADLIWCEWMLGNAVWYSNRITDKKKLFIRMHRFELTTKWFTQIDFRKVNRVFAVSVYFFEKLIEYTHIPRSMAYLLPNYLDSENYQKAATDKNKLFNIGVIGILPARKGYLDTLKVLKKLTEKNKQYRLFVYGKMPHDLSWIKNNPTEIAYYDECQQFILKNNLQQNVVEKGWVDVKAELKEVGFILSTSHNEEIPESFHIAPADGFAAGNQGLLLNWNGVEYIYPEKYIFSTINEMAEHIDKQKNLAEFDDFNKEGAELVATRYSLENVIGQINKCVRLSVNRYAYAPFLSLQKDINNYKSIFYLKNTVLNMEGIAFDLPKYLQSGVKLKIEYSFSLSDNTRVNAALVSLNTSAKNISGFNLSNIESIGIYKYLVTTSNNKVSATEINIPDDAVVESIIFKLWQKDAIIKIHELKVLICV